MQRTSSYRLELLVGLPLQPREEVDTRAVLDGEVRNLRRIGPPVGLGPVSDLKRGAGGSLEVLGQCFE
jgi:hypothetical protein